MRKVIAMAAAGPQSDDGTWIESLRSYLEESFKRADDPVTEPPTTEEVEEDAE
jgi:hypothetical protein